MNDERLPSRGDSFQTSRLSSHSQRHFDFMDTHHSVFSRNSYYDDMRLTHPWSRRPCSRLSGIPFTTLRASSCSPRLDDLSKPRIKRDRLIREEVFNNLTNYAYSGVKPSALKHRHSDRLTRLSQPRKLPPTFVGAYVLPKAVPEPALHARTTDRVRDLSKPRTNIVLLNDTWKNGQK